MNDQKNVRKTSVNRETKETSIQIDLNLDGQRKIKVATGLGMLDHMVSALAFHAGWDLNLAAKGDLYIDDHHTVEDCGLLLGTAIKQLTGDNAGLRRFGSAYAPLDEALSRTVIDFSGRPHAKINLGLKRERLGQVACENLTHFFQSLSTNALITLHVDVLRGENDHHRAEAAFKATALAFREALTVVHKDGTVPSTKGVLS